MNLLIQQERPDAPESIDLIAELDAYLDALYPPESQHGLSVSELLAVDVQFFVARQDGAPAGCGAVKRFGGEYAEVKRMYVRPAFRGRGLGRAILERLERVMQEQNIPLLRLETGIHQIEAIGLYERFGFYEIAPFGDYLPDPLSRFFEKRLSAI